MIFTDGEDVPCPSTVVVETTACTFHDRTVRGPNVVCACPEVLARTSAYLTFPPSIIFSLEHCRETGIISQKNN